MSHLEKSRLSSTDYLQGAYNVAKNSPDVSTKVGAILVNSDGEIISMSYNSPLVNLPTNASREDKYKYTSHAEEKAILVAARLGCSTRGATLYCPWAACHDCAKAIVVSGIKEVVAHGDAIDKTPERWADSINAAMRLFEENGVIYTKVYGKIGDCENLFDGEIWYP